MGGVQQNWAGQCEIVGGVGLSCRGTICNVPRALLISAGVLGVLRAPPAGPGQNPGGGPGGKALRSSWNFAFSSG